MGKSTISMAIFHSYVCLPEGSPSHQPESTESTESSQSESAGTFWLLLLDLVRVSGDELFHVSAGIPLLDEDNPQDTKGRFSSPN